MASGAVAGASRTTRMRRSPTAYSISLRPVSSSSAASARMRSPSTARSPGFAITRSPISRLPIGGDEARHRLQRQEIALAAQTADHAGRGEADIGAMAEALAPEDVGDVHLDDRQGGSAQRVENGNGGMCIAAGIDDDTVGRFARLLDPIDELPLVVRLAEVDGEAERGGALGLAIDFRQSNHEGQLIDWIQEAREASDGIVINPGGYTHTSVAILDALRAATLPIIEVHISNIFRRERFRHRSYVSLAATGVICGLGSQGYLLALEAMARLVAANGQA